MAWFTGGVLEKFYDKIPLFVRDHQTVRADIAGDSDDYKPNVPWRNERIDKANLLTSKDASATGYGIEYHRPVLDIDFEAALVPSSTPGHYHLFLDRVMSWTQYENLLRALADAGILERGFVDCSIQRKASSVRLPWIKKDDWDANQIDPAQSLRDLQEDIIRAEQALQQAKAKLDKAFPF